MKQIRPVGWFAALVVFATLTSSLSAQAQLGYPRDFPAGSLIIPMDLSYQDSGMFQAYGLVFQLLRQGITLYWVINPTKTWHTAPCAPETCTWDCPGETDNLCPYPTADPDFYATAEMLWDDENRTLATITHGYRGGPFVIDAAQADQAKTIIDTWNSQLTAPSACSTTYTPPWYLRTGARVVSVHRAAAQFTGNVRKEMVAAPSIAVFSDGNENIATSYLRAAGIKQSNGCEFPAAKCACACGKVCTTCGAGTLNPDMLTVPSVMGDAGTCGSPNANHKNGALFTPEGVPAYCQIMSMHWNVDDRDTVQCNCGNCAATRTACAAATKFTYHGHEVVAEVRQFLNYPTHFFAECQAVNAYENAVANPAWPFLDDADRTGHFLTTVGTPPNCPCTGADTAVSCVANGCDNGTRSCCLPTSNKERGAGFLIGDAPGTAVKILSPEVPYNQLDGAFTSTGGSEPSYNLSSYFGSAYKNDMSVTFITGVNGPGKEDVWMNGYLDGVCNIITETGDDCEGVGKVSYLGGHSYKTNVPLSSNGDSQGTRLFLNALFEADCVTSVGQPFINLWLADSTNLPITSFPAEITYTASYWNSGVSPALDAKLSLVVPGTTTVTAYDSPGAPTADGVEWDLGAVGGQVGMPGDPPPSGSLSATVSFAAAGDYALEVHFTYRVGVTTFEAVPYILNVHVEAFVDTDGDGVPDSKDPDSADPKVCGDSDGDGCDDCSVAGQFAPDDDGLDTDGDGLCDPGDPDQDNDSVPNGDDPAPLDPYECGDSDGDTCDDCSLLGYFAPDVDGTDTDGDGLCDSGDPELGVTQEVEVKPWFLIIMDSSGSMRESSDPNSCGYPSTKIGAAKCSLYRLVSGVGDAVFGLEQFAQVTTGTNCPFGHGGFPWDCYCFDGNACCAEGVGPCNNNASSGKMLVSIREDNQDKILHFVDGGPNCPYGEEIVAANYTPLGGSLALARDYFCAGSAGASPACGSAPMPFNVSPAASDTHAACRPMSVILLTDGDETCDGNAVQRATELRSTRIPVPRSVDPGGYITKDIRTYVIGFGYSCPYSKLDNIASAGGTHAPGDCAAFYAQNEQDLSLVFSQIVADSQLVEICNGADDDCDGLTDEGFGAGKSCAAGIGACRRQGTIECVSEVESKCNAVAGASGSESEPLGNCRNSADDDCDGMTDCQDNECNGLAICSCVSEPEICDGVDNDCDGLTDEDAKGKALTRPCSAACGWGTQACVGGEYGDCDAPQPEAETCNNLDDDCDGLVDNGNPGGGARCLPNFDGTYTELKKDEPIDPGRNICRAGTVTCVAGKYLCEGSVSGAKEICNCLDDDCDGRTDEDADLCGSRARCLDCRCVSPCMESEFQCPPGRYCDTSFADSNIIGLCLPSKCEGVKCADTEACNPKTGECEDLCARVACGSGYVCSRGSCIEDNCYGLGCPAGERCRDSKCEKDPCLGKECGKDQFCRDGKCVNACLDGCPAGQTCAGGKCVEDRCGGPCYSGQSCVDGRCVRNTCGECGDARVCLGDRCVDDPCAGIRCPKGTSCASGECSAGGGQVPAGGGQAANPAGSASERVVAAGGGGCACSIAGGASPSGTAGAGAMGLALALFGLLAIRRRKRTGLR